MEGDLIGTYAGQIAYKRNIAGISQCCQETVNFHTVVKLLTCKDYQRELQDLNRNGDSKALQKIEEDEIADFAVLAYDKEGFIKMVERGREVIRKSRGTADTLIVFPGFPYYNDMVAHAVYTEYYKSGPNGIQLLTQGPASNGNFRGIPIFETRGYSVYNDGINFQPLLRRVAVGEYAAVTYEWRGKPIAADYKSDHRSIYLYSIDDDEYKKVSFLSIFQHSNMFGGDENNPSGLAPQTQVLADAANAAFNRQGGFDEEAKRYGSVDALEKLENVQGGVTSNRRLYMMLAHNVAERRVAPAETLGELDIDVAPTADFEACARSIVNKMFHPETSEGVEIETALHMGERFVRRMEDVPYNDDYFRALAFENVNGSVTSKGAFQGFQKDDQSPIAWLQNAFNALDLPDRKKSGNAARWTDPVGAVSYGWFKTIAAQGTARGYDKDVIDAATEIVKAIDRVVARQTDVMPDSYAFLLSKAPAWLQNASAEDVMFGALFHQRPPMLLGVPSAAAFQGTAAVGVVPTRAARLADEAAKAKELQEGVQLLWTPVTADGTSGAVVIPAAQPQTRLLDVLVGGLAGVGGFTAANADLWRPVNTATALDGYLLALLKTVDNVQESEAARKRLIAALFALLNTHARDADYALKTLREVAKFVATGGASALAAPLAAALNNASMLTDVGEQVAKIEKAAATMRAEIDAAKKANKATSTTDKAAGEAILKFQFGASPVNIVNPSGGATTTVFPMRVELAEAINEQATAPMSGDSGGVSNATALARLEEKFDEIGREIYENSDSALLTLKTYPAWKNSVAKERRVAAKDVTKINKAYNDYTVVADSLQRDAVKAYNAKLTSLIGASAADADDDDDNVMHIGDKVPRADYDTKYAPEVTSTIPDPSDAKKTITVKTRVVQAAAPQVWFLSPVMNSPALLRSMNGANFLGGKMPMVLPTDPNSDYRTALLPWSYNDGTNVRRANMDIMAHLTSDSAMMPISSDMTMADVKPLHNEAWVRAKQNYAPIAATFFSTDIDLMAEHRSEVPVGVRGAHIGDQLDVNAIKAQAREEAERIGVAFGDEGDEAVLTAIKERDAKRAEMGLPAGAWVNDFQRAAADIRAQDATTRASAQRAAALANFQPLQSGAHGSFGDQSLSVIAMENARTFSTTMRSAGMHLKTESERAAERRARAAGALPTPPIDQFDTAAVNRGFAEKKKEFDDVNYADYMATDDGYVPTEQERRAAAFRRQVGYDRREPMAMASARAVLEEFGYSKAPAPEVTASARKELHQNVRYRFAKAHATRNPLLKSALLALIYSKNAYETWYSMIVNDVHVPINFIVWRLFIELELDTCILLQSGIETGANVLGHTNMVFSNTSADKMMHGHFTYHHATMIWNQQFVHHLTDVMPAGYIAGWNTDFIMSTEELSEDDRGSIIVTPIPITENNLPRKLCFIRTTTQRLLPSVVNRPKNQRAVNDYSSAGFAELTWELSESKIAQGNTGQNWVDSSVRINVMAWRGVWWSYNPADGYFSKKNHGHGHLSGNRTGPGCRRVFLGTGNGFCDDQRTIDQSLRLQ